MVQSDVFEVFQTFGLDFHFGPANDPYLFFFNEKKLRDGLGLRGLRSIEVPLDRLSNRRHIARFS
jgi:hypothetical protein